MALKDEEPRLQERRHAAKRVFERLRAGCAARAATPPATDL